MVQMVRIVWMVKWCKGSEYRVKTRSIKVAARCQVYRKRVYNV